MRVALLAMIILSIGSLILWIAFLGFTLPISYQAHNWDIAWVGFDLGMFSALLVTGLAIWRRRQIAIPAAVVTSTFLAIDSWLDIVTANSTSDRLWAVLSATLIQIPLGVLLAIFSRNAMRKSIRSAYRHAGMNDQPISVRRTTLHIFDD